MFLETKTEIVGQQRHLHSEEVKINQRAWLPELGIELPDIYKEKYEVYRRIVLWVLELTQTWRRLQLKIH
jgi:5-formaminoimidazole-4-carboxamide-1-beta-D-ribofuranosyl 5'-monophosphate synthetase